MSKADYTGQTFGRWIVLRKDEELSRDNTIRWICRCACGTEKSVVASSLRTGSSTSCGCPNNIQEMIGQSYGKWRATGIAGKSKKDGKTLLACICECGTEKDIAPVRLRTGKTRSCGCWRSKKITKPRPAPITLTFAYKTATLAEWAKITGIGYATLLTRHKMGWTVENILFMPVRPLPKKLVMEAADQKADYDEKLMDTSPAITE